MAPTREILIRQARPDDAGALRAILRDTFESTWLPQLTPEAAEAYRGEDRPAAYVGERGLLFLVAEVDGAVVGLVDWNGDFVNALHVLASHARSGVGSRLMDHAEAAMAAEVFRDQGIAPERVILEGQARNTAENARLSRALAAPAAGEVWVLVTSAFHMPRAMRSFEAAGWTGVVAYPVDYRTAAFRDGIGWDLAGNLAVLNTAIKEQVGQLGYQMTGR